MSFRDNLLHLRAAHNMTQEQLAMLLGVSRQSVTKWESERSYPEMDKLLKMCQVFDCTLDELVQGDLTDRPAPDAGTGPAAPPAPPADVFGYDESMRRFANRISGGIMVIILGIAASIVMYSLGEGPTDLVPLDVVPASLLPENMAAMLGLLCTFAGIGAGLSLIIPAGLAHSQFVRAHPYLDDFYTAQQKASARTTFTYELIGGIMAIFAGICAIVPLADTAYETILGVPLMLACIAVGVRFIVHGGMTLARVNIAEYNRSAAEVLDATEIANAPVSPEQREALMRDHRTDKRVGAVCGTIMIVATVIALLMLFLPMAGSPEGANYTSGAIALFWLPWPIGGLLCGIATLLIKGFGSDRA